MLKTTLMTVYAYALGAYEQATTDLCGGRCYEEERLDSAYGAGMNLGDWIHAVWSSLRAHTGLLAFVWLQVALVSTVIALLLYRSPGVMFASIGSFIGLTIVAGFAISLAYDWPARLAHRVAQYRS